MQTMRDRVGSSVVRIRAGPVVSVELLGLVEGVKRVLTNQGRFAVLRQLTRQCAFDRPQRGIGSVCLIAGTGICPGITAPLPSRSVPTAPAWKPRCSPFSAWERDRLTGSCQRMWIAVSGCLAALVPGQQPRGARQRHTGMRAAED